jgi:D-glycero-D-manno-heptose 1,7-bisphosphate phosphatase
MPADIAGKGKAEMKRAVFFDRDGTLMEDAHYCRDPELVKVYAGVPEALRRLHGAGFVVLIVTNQSGIGRGLITESEYRAVEEEFLRQAGRESIDGSYYCPDVPGVPSECRKPEPGMVLRAAAEHAVDLSASYFVGDKAIDIECGRRAGVRTILVLTGYGREQNCAPDLTCADAVEAVERILAGTAQMPGQTPTNSRAGS